MAQSVLRWLILLECFGFSTALDPSNEHFDDGNATRKLAAWPVYGSCLEITENADCEGNDIAHQEGKSADECCTICSEHPGCRAFSYRYGQCYLKTKCVRQYNINGCKSGTLPSSPAGVAVFYPGIQSSKCYRIPSIIRTHKGTLLAFAENRPTGCGDDSSHHHLLVVRRSSDGGKVWGNMYIVKKGQPPCDGCPPAISNPNPVEVKNKDGSYSILLHYDTMNNPSKSKHGVDRQIWSHNDGVTWVDDSIIAYPPHENEGIMIGPSIGIQHNSGRIYMPGQSFIYYSDDYGKSWASWDLSPARHENSIAFADGPGGNKILQTIRGPGNNRRQVLWTDGKPSEVSTPEGMDSAYCQGSIMYNSANGYLYLSLAKGYDRSRLTIKCSRDGGKSWSNGIEVWHGPSGYSQLVDIKSETHVGVLFEAAYSNLFTEGRISYVEVDITKDSFLRDGAVDMIDPHTDANETEPVLI